MHKLETSMSNNQAILDKYYSLAYDNNYYIKKRTLCIVTTTVLIKFPLI